MWMKLTQAWGTCSTLQAVTRSDSMLKDNHCVRDSAVYSTNCVSLDMSQRGRTANSEKLWLSRRGNTIMGSCGVCASWWQVLSSSVLPWVPSIQLNTASYSLWRGTTPSVHLQLIKWKHFESTGWIKPYSKLFHSPACHSRPQCCEQVPFANRHDLESYRRGERNIEAALITYFFLPDWEGTPFLLPRKLRLFHILAF